MNSFQLKLLACIFMFIDHLGVMIFTDSDIFRIVGRLSFPIFAFLMSEGYKYTKDIKKYLLRLLLFAIVLQIPYTIAIGDKTLNIFFTLFLGLFLILIDDKVKNILVKVILIVLMGYFAQWIGVDYGYYGVYLIYMFRKFKDNFMLLVIAFLFLNISVINAYDFQVYSILSTVLIMTYDGKRGLNNLWVKYGFYIFYPTHILIIYGISLLIK